MTSLASPSLSKESRLSHLHLIATNYVGLASYVVLIYDHVLTFPDEVQFMWKGNKGPIVYLFFFNRYFFPFAFIINLFAYLSRALNPSQCKRFVRYEGSCVILGLAIAGLVMSLRVNALYLGSKRIQAFLAAIWIGMISVSIWLLSRGYPVPRLHGEYGCSMIFDPTLGGWAAASSAAPLMFDSCIVILTLCRTLRAVRSHLASKLVKTLFEDGVLYFGSIFATNLALTIMIVKSPPGLKNILGQFAEVITVTMISRLCIHLRKVGSETIIVLGSDGSKTAAKNGWSNSSELDSDANAHSLAFLQTASGSTAATTSELTESFGCTSDDLDVGGAENKSSNRFSGSTICVGGKGVYANGLGSSSDWKGKGKATSATELDIEARGNFCEEDEDTDKPDFGTYSPDVPDHVRLCGRDLAVPGGGFDLDEADAMRRSMSRNKIELVRLVKDIRQYIYPAEVD
ncbi:hypothetical protein SCHPADRAFT_943676 [Schizopora paradoxa]|uniref:DUF6533 domain-containing protein n=1 Tax=Schizopora paradoxa TaxID=27342 RepID=A0A0H2RX41_9AGAM|nr:hypothetical protein SCHPADRAFT_943676 [Schizopora paradoxa]